ncbi:MAG: HBL/NHE enterotoxin family protein [Nitrospina sp.]|jgi:non-hemolytic enterotoxin B/C|nr:HBL/NHE enterotoxin family protein [Nitrospina sp.]
MADSAIAINQGMANQSGQALQIQNYCNSVKMQAPVDFSDFPNLKSNETEINNGLTLAKKHADKYLNVIQPQIITNITNIDNYYALHQAVPAVLPPGSTNAQWVAQLTVLKEQAEEYKKLSSDTSLIITSLHDNLTIDAANFQTIVVNLNSKVNGDNGVLSHLDSEISKINAAIDGAIAGIVVGGLLVVGGAFVTAIGAISEFVTAGTSTLVVIGGVAMMVAGAAGITAGAIVLHSALNARDSLYHKKSTLKSEVKLASGIATGYVGLKNQAANAVTAATQMGNAWDELTGDLGSLVLDLDKGITSADAVRKLWLTAADTTVKTVITDIRTIKAQMAGVSTLSVPRGTTIANFVGKLAA